MQKDRNKKLIWSVIMAVCGCLVFASPAFAYFTDTEEAIATIQTQTLSFEATSLNDFNIIKKPSEEPSRTFNLTKTGTLDFSYIIEVENISGDLCANLELKDDFGNFYQALNGFSSPLIDFTVKPNVATTARMISGDAQWQSKNCDFELVLKARQPELSGGQGFSDEKRFSAKIESGKWIINPGDVVINELMWMGSYLNAQDEWIELRNTTSYELDLSGFQLTKLIGLGLSKQEAFMLQIPNGSVIPANGFFLISRLDKASSKINVMPDLVDSSVNLRDANLQIKLYKADWSDLSNLIDTADDGTGYPAAGWEGLFFHLSMERNDVPGDGSQDNNWHTCLDYANTRIYWNAGNIFDLGTPGALNLSDELDGLLQFFIDEEQELLVEGKYLPDTEKGLDGGLILFEQASVPTLSTPPAEEIIAEQEPEAPIEEIIQEPEVEESKTEDPVIIEVPEENNNETNLEQEVPIENQASPEDNTGTSTNSDGSVEQNNNESNETPEIV